MSTRTSTRGIPGMSQITEPYTVRNLPQHVSGMWVWYTKTCPQRHLNYTTSTWSSGTVKPAFNDTSIMRIVSGSVVNQTCQQRHLNYTNSWMCVCYNQADFQRYLTDIPCNSQFWKGCPFRPIKMCPWIKPIGICFNSIRPPDLPGHRFTRKYSSKPFSEESLLANRFWKFLRRPFGAIDAPWEFHR